MSSRTRWAAWSPRRSLPPARIKSAAWSAPGPGAATAWGALPTWVRELFTRKYEQQEDMWLPILFTPTQASQAAGRVFIKRILARADRDARVSDQSIAAQGAAPAAYGTAKDPSYAQQLIAVRRERYDDASSAGIMRSLKAPRQHAPDGDPQPVHPAD